MSRKHEVPFRTLENLQAQLVEARAKHRACEVHCAALESELHERDGMYQLERSRDAQARKDLDQKDHELAEARAEVEQLRADGATVAASIQAKRAEQAEAKLKAVVEALEQIVEGAGPFSRDPLEHASNCINAMKAAALAALAAAQEKP